MVKETVGDIFFFHSVVLQWMWNKVPGAPPNLPECAVSNDLAEPFLYVFS